MGKKQERDIVVKIGGLRLYFQNRYTIVSLVNDILTGLFYLIGSICNFLGAPSIYGNTLFLIGGILFVGRPVIKLLYNMKIYYSNQEKKEKDDSHFDEDDFFAVKYSEGEREGDPYQAEYYGD